MNNFDQFKNTYIAECFELLIDMEERLTNLDDDPSNEDMNAIFRCAHSIKGGAGAFGFTHITKFTHSLENCLDLMREGKIQTTKHIISILLKSADMLNKLVQAAQFGEEFQDDYSSELRAEIDKISNNNHDIVKGGTEQIVVQDIKNQMSEYKIKFFPHLNLLSTGNEPVLIIRELKSLGDLTVNIDSSEVPILENLDLNNCYLKFEFALRSECTLETVKEVFEFVEDNCVLEINVTEPPKPIIVEVKEKEPIITIDKQNDNASKSKAQSSNNTIRVELDKIDRLVNMVGELVITQSMLISLTKDKSIDNFSKILRGVEELSQHSRELQEAVMSVRMQPVKTIFLRMPRIVRDLAHQLNKEVKLVFNGENTEVDKTVIEMLSDPLTHMIRNSIDHGIETPADRKKYNKPPVGTITITAFHHGGKIMIEISDDGQGINRDRVYSKAIEKNLIAKDVELAPEEIDKLIFLPGFSTAETVSNVSGRGVGMDVVKNNIEELGGSVKITNNPGKGSMITISLPLTLAILEGMIIRAVDENYIIPISNIIESLRIGVDNIHTVSNNSRVIDLRGEFISVFELANIFNIESKKSDSDNKLIVLLENGDKRFGLIVDELIGQQQVVIKTLEPNTHQVAGISGATILGDGKVALIIDVDQLENLVSRENCEI